MTATYSHPVYGYMTIVLHGRDPRTWHGCGGWTYCGKGK